MNSPAVIARSAHDAVECEVAGAAAVFDSAGVLWLPRERLLVVSDLHLEKGAAFARRGRMLPPYDTAETLSRLGGLVDRYDPGAIISLGDSFHDRDGSAHLPAPYREALAALAHRRDWFWIAGNHDPEPPADLPGDHMRELAFGGFVFRHEPSRGSARGEVAGHLHPGARLVRRGCSIRRPCFATDGARLVMPAFGSFTGTLNVLDRAFVWLFAREALTAYMLGPSRLYAIPGAALSPG